MWDGAADDESYAEEFLAATMRLVDEIEGYLHRRNWDLVLRGVYLTGRYPDTKLVVECLDPSSSTRPERKASFEVWGTGEVHLDSGQVRMLDPRTFAGIVATNIMEGAFDD